MSANTLAPRLAAGAAAPDVSLLGADGAALRLASLWADGPAVISFLRHFG